MRMIVALYRCWWLVYEFADYNVNAMLENGSKLFITNNNDNNDTDDSDYI